MDADFGDAGRQIGVDYRQPASHGLDLHQSEGLRRRDRRERQEFGRAIPRGQVGIGHGALEDHQIRDAAVGGAAPEAGFEGSGSDDDGWYVASGDGIDQHLEAFVADQPSDGEGEWPPDPLANILDRCCRDGVRCEPREVEPERYDVNAVLEARQDSGSIAQLLGRHENGVGLRAEFGLQAVVGEPQQSPADDIAVPCHDQWRRSGQPKSGHRSRGEGFVDVDDVKPFRGGVHVLYERAGPRDIDNPG